MKKLFDKNELTFALVCIAVYVAGCGFCDSISERLPLEKLLTLPFIIVFSALLFLFAKKNGLLEYVGLCRSKMAASVFLYYVPLFIIFSVNLWQGVSFAKNPAVLAINIVFMLFVGFAEEIVFRGFLFRAIAKDNIRTAVIVSSITFGLGHIVNALNGNLNLYSALLQIFYAAAVGFLFSVIVWKGGSLVPCIIAHSANNMLSVIADSEGVSAGAEGLTAAAMCVLCILYTLVILRNTGIKKD